MHSLSQSSGSTHRHLHLHPPQSQRSPGIAYTRLDIHRPDQLVARTPEPPKAPLQSMARSKPFLSPSRTRCSPGPNFLSNYEQTDLDAWPKPMNSSPTSNHSRFRLGTLRLALLLPLIFVGGWCKGQQVLLTDSFDSASYSAASFNSTLAVDQGGTLAPPSERAVHPAHQLLLRRDSRRRQPNQRVLCSALTGRSGNRRNFFPGTNHDLQMHRRRQTKVLFASVIRSLHARDMERSSGLGFLDHPLRVPTPSPFN